MRKPVYFSIGSKLLTSLVKLTLIASTVSGVATSAFAQGANGGGGGGSDQYADRNILLIARQIAVGLRITGGSVQGVALTEIADYIERAQVKPENVVRKVNGRDRLLMMDYDSVNKRILILPPLVSMVGLKDMEDLTPSEIRNARLSFIHEAAHLKGIGTNRSGDNDHLARAFANEVYFKMEHTMFACQWNEGKLTDIFAFNPALMIFNYPRTSKKTNFGNHKC